MVVRRLQLPKRLNFLRIEFRLTLALESDDVSHSGALFLLDLCLLLFSGYALAFGHLLAMHFGLFLVRLTASVLVIERALLVVLLVKRSNDIVRNAACRAGSYGLADGRATGAEVLDVLFSPGS